MTEPFIRLTIFLSVFIFMGCLEYIIPKRMLLNSRKKRWLTNGALTILNVIFIRISLPFSVINIAIYAELNNIGLLHIINMPSWLQITAAVILLDLVIYTQHMVFHKVSFLWRLHKIHHTDRDIDVSTALRFHPIEMLISIAIKVMAVLALGVPAEAVLLFEIILNSMALFNHSNVNLPFGLDKALKLLWVTPDMHRIHHSIYPTETNSNYGFNLSIWDKLFGTYVREPKDPQNIMTIGLNQYQEDDMLNIADLLILPFRKK